jgi:hypothetical protein
MDTLDELEATLDKEIEPKYFDVPRHFRRVYLLSFEWHLTLLT